MNSIRHSTGIVPILTITTTLCVRNDYSGFFFSDEETEAKRG